MSTATQIQPVSFGRWRFPHISPPKAVVNIIASKRHASTADLNESTGTAVHKQRRTVSSPMAADKSDTESEAEENPSQDVSTTPGFHHHLTFPHAAKLFVKLRRVQKKVKAHHIDSDSGDQPITDRSLLNVDGKTEETKKLARLEIQEVYVCLDGVDVATLLRASRTALLDRASPLHANVLVDEQWTCSICGPKHRSDGSFRVHIRYAATAATSPKRDSRQPVSLDKTSGVPGLMTISNRDTVGLTVVELYEDVQITQS